MAGDQAQDDEGRADGSKGVRLRLLSARDHSFIRALLAPRGLARASVVIEGIAKPMCVSPEASFAVSSVLAIVGIATIRKALRYNRSMLAFSLFPAIFSFHQFIEGLVWLSVDGAFNGKVFRYSYILIAVLLWPFLTPLASALAEPDPRRKAARFMLLAAGLVLTGYLAFKLANATGIDVKVVGHSLSYLIGYDTRPPEFIRYAYAAVAIIPLVTLPNRAINALGILVGVAFLYTVFEMKEVWYSVWCLTAAMFSVLIFFSVHAPRTDARPATRE